MDVTQNWSNKKINNNNSKVFIKFFFNVQTYIHLK